MTFPTYDHLTPEQNATLDDALFDVTLDDVQKDSSYLKSIIESYIESMETLHKLGALSDDEDVRCQLLGFDPETGKPTE